MGMGGRSRGGSLSMATEGEDQIYNLILNFKEDVFGVEKEMEISHLDTGGTCYGSGAKPGTMSSNCSSCGGQGQIASAAGTQLVMTCSSCTGTGETNTPCNTCGVYGRIRKSKCINLKIPAVVVSAISLWIRSEGGTGRRGGSPDDLFVVIDVPPDPVLVVSDYM